MVFFTRLVNVFHIQVSRVKVPNCLCGAALRLGTALSRRLLGKMACPGKTVEEPLYCPVSLIKSIKLFLMNLLISFFKSPCTLHAEQIVKLMIKKTCNQFLRKKYKNLCDTSL